MMAARLTLVRISAVAEGMYFCSTHSAQVSKMRIVDSLSATVILLALLEECNPDTSNDRATYRLPQERPEVGLRPLLALRKQLLCSDFSRQRYE